MIEQFEKFHLSKGDPINNRVPVKYLYLHQREIEMNFERVETEKLKNDFRINELPNSLWPIILIFFSLQELVHFYLVCKKWKTIFDENLHWKLRSQSEFLSVNNLDSNFKYFCEKYKTDRWKDFYKNSCWKISSKKFLLSFILNLFLFYLFFFFLFE